MDARCPRPCVVCEEAGLEPMKRYDRAPEPHRERAAHAIRALVRKYEAHPWDINNGDCEEFAHDLMEALGPDAQWADCGDARHSCVKFHGRYYDAEEPYGVKHWRQLPLCVRYRRK